MSKLVVKRKTSISKTDKEYLVKNMRACDTMEVLITHSMTPEEAINFSIATSSEKYVGYVEGIPILIGGVVRGDLVDMPWMLGTDEIHKYKKTFWKVFKQKVEEMKRDKPLWGLIHRDQTFNIQCLERLGFTLHQRTEHIKEFLCVPQH